jgi:hypothetical protein
VEDNATRRLAGTALLTAALFSGIVDVEAHAQTPTCATENLNAAFGRIEGTPGTVYREVRFTNRGTATCTTRGFPGMSYVDDNRRQVGTAAVWMGAAALPHTLRPGATVSSNAGFVQVDNFDPAVCMKKPVWGVRVYPPDQTVPLYLRLNGQSGCSGNVVQLSVTALYSPG